MRSRSPGWGDIKFTATVSSFARDAGLRRNVEAIPHPTADAVGYYLSALRAWNASRSNHTGRPVCGTLIMTERDGSVGLVDVQRSIRRAFAERLSDSAPRFLFRNIRCLPARSGSTQFLRYFRRRRKSFST